MAPGRLWGLLIFSVLHFLWNGVAVGSFHSHVRGWSGDNLMFLWNVWWVGSLEWLPGFNLGAPPIFQPDGASFFFHSHSMLAGLMAVPFRAFGGDWPVVAHNYIQLASTALSGLAGMEIARTAGVRRTIALLAAGATVAFSAPRLFAAYGHLNLFQTEFLLFSMLFAFKASIETSIARTQWFIAGVFSGLAWLNESTYGIFSCFFWAVALLSRWMRTRSSRDLWDAAWFPASSLLVSGLVIVELIRVFASGKYFVPSLDNERVCDALNFFLPTDYHRYLGVPAYQFRLFLGIGGGEGVAFAGYGGLLALLFGVWLFVFRGHRLAGPMKLWLVVGGGACLLALGESFTTGGTRVLPLPGAILRHVPVISNLRVPERVMVMAAPALGCLVAKLLDDPAPLSRWAQHLFFAAWLALFSLGIPLHRIHSDMKAPPFRLDDKIVAVLKTHRAAAPNGTVLTLPVSFSDGEELWHQTQHGLPIAGGYVARLDPRVPSRRFEDHPILWQLRLGGEFPRSSYHDVWRELRVYLLQENIRFVILRKDRWSEGARLFQAAGSDAFLIHEDERIAAYEIVSD